MAKIVDVRGSGGEFVVLGDALTLPSSDADNPSILPGSIRYNPASGALEARFSRNGGPAAWEALATTASIESSYLPLVGGTLTGTLTVQADIISTGTVKAAMFDGLAVSAIYGADLAERYHADAIYEPGTVLVVGGCKEVTACTSIADTAVAGIVSTSPAYTMNVGAGGDDTHPFVALRGRVPCKVVGPVRKGQMLVTSAIAGHAMAAPPDAHPRAVVGIALADFSGEIGLVEVLV